ncbi:Antitoxin Phd_YefM, type II toxin-antitoxin system [Acididesulfobacillus acetoxydans]|uniref:Antitoxin n=1 Tax=Acididesulfobacillus acetoxydans TaxID=1561005 RepID=A0A8S0VY58_9FIRM|nr:type II toxin-antitoxin system Phd/YefM family antitoxin [Acididesulfobacillus acetoxydans]CAA7602643.1 Antitoxin Phd_YefM, type II toxin-antitoxin system [Acididesulfobacillus acetoxydans]CEJ09160.1 Antitoxin Phd_YefM, type II toxin-antitoxin system [Acididesulfobacillus acetoxydans]
MPNIRPISDLRNNFAEISRIVHVEKEPVFLTKNGYGDMVVMSLEQYEGIQLTQRIEAALHEAEAQAESDPTRYTEPSGLSHIFFSNVISASRT